MSSKSNSYVTVSEIWSANFGAGAALATVGLALDDFVLTASGAGFLILSAFIVYLAKSGSGGRNSAGKRPLSGDYAE